MSNEAIQVDQECDFPQRCGAIELIIQPRNKDLGGFSARRALPNAQRRMVGPWLFFDLMGPAEFPAGRGINVRPHPHTRKVVGWSMKPTLARETRAGRRDDGGAGRRRAVLTGYGDDADSRLCEIGRHAIEFRDCSEALQKKYPVGARMDPVVFDYGSPSHFRVAMTFVQSPGTRVGIRYYYA